jgi:hypothetical protein
MREVPLLPGDPVPASCTRISSFFLLSALPAALLLLAADAHAESRTLTYQLYANEKTTGTREAKLNYLTGETGEVVTIQAWTDLGLSFGNVAYKYKQRLGGRFGGNRSFTSSMNDNGTVREVQGQVDVAGNWDVTVVENGGAKHWILGPDAVDLTSAEFLDPDRALKTLEQVGVLRVLATESGAIMSGPLESVGMKDIQIGRQKIQVHQYKWSPSEGTMILSYDANGMLIAYDTTVIGHAVSARLTNPPPARTYEDSFSPPLTTNPVGEEGVR